VNRPLALKLFHMDRRKESRDRRIEEAMQQAKFDVLMGDAEVCPDFAKHTNQPRDYSVWYEWAERMHKTHKQVPCKTCGIHAIWVPKRPRKK
jgi:hypothetical protein